MVNWHVVHPRKVSFSRMLFLILVTFPTLLVACTAPNQPLLPLENTPPTPYAVWTTEPTFTNPTLAPTPTSSPQPHLPSPTILPSPSSQTCTSKTGHYEVHALPLTGLDTPLNLRVYLPPCYAFYKNQYYPVLYLFHGFRYTDDQWQRLGVGETIESLLAAGEIPPFLVVMPLDRTASEPDENPLDHLFIDEIIPWVDQNFRTLTERQYRAIGGLSRGAGWAVHFGLTRWEYFGAVGAHSLALFWYDSRRLPQLLDGIPTGKAPRFYLDMGNSDAQLDDPLYDFLEELDKRNIPHEWHLFRGYHDEDYWSSHLVYYLRWYTLDWSNLIP